MNIIIFSGSYNINELGATRSIDTMLIKYLKEFGHNVTWVGIGQIELDVTTISFKKNIIKEFFSRIYLKCLRLLIKSEENKMYMKNRKLLSEYVDIDRRLYKLIRKNKIFIDDKTVVLGRNGMSYLSFKAAKDKGATTILHSQWMHPVTQRELLINDYKEMGISEPILKERIARQIDEIKIVDKIWCISSAVRQSYIENGVSEEPLFNVPLGVDIQKFAPSRTRQDKFRIIFVGTINYEKGVHLLFEALLSSSLENIEVIFNGSVPEYFKSLFDQYRQKAESRNMRIILAPGDPVENYKKSSIFVLPSIHESFGLVVLEAMSSGLPVIVSNSVGASDCVKHNVNGFKFESGNVKKLRESIETLYYDRKLTDKFGKNSREIALDYSWEKICRQLESNINIK